MMKINNFSNELVAHELLCDKFGRIKVLGSSMYPILQSGDEVCIAKKTDYDVGDVLVFHYRPNVILVHRLVKKEANRYFCKGDNAFRIEDVCFEAIIGVVLLQYDPHRNQSFIEDSLHINYIYRKNHYNIEKTKEQYAYKQYMINYLSTV